MAECTVVLPTTLEEALASLATWGDDAAPVAGGVWVTLTLRSGLLGARWLLSLRQLPEAGQLAIDSSGQLVVGPLVTHRALERASLVRQHWPVLAETLADVANVRVREQATLVGNLCEADPASDPPALLAALGASVELASTRGRRIVPVSDFVRGAYRTVREPDELVTALRIPPLPAAAGATYLKFRTRSHEDRPAVGVAAVVVPDSAGRIAQLELVVGAAGDYPQRFPALLERARGRWFDQALVAELSEGYASSVETVSDLRASDWYRRELVRVLVARALRRAARRAGLVDEGSGEEG
jgi:carbon-monoxide dehydrogenase medium subunit